MIVVDTNILAYLYLPTECTPLAERLLERKPDWSAPLLWRSELRNVLTLYLRKRLLTFDQAYAIQTEAETLLADREYTVDSFEVLRLVGDSECSAYDCEFVALAKRLAVPLVTSDRKVLKNFPGIAISLGVAAR
ncbi:MAG TPA: type II toxin-antitoxin system VapC family toxin [Methylococcus sp.]|nr:type II toxin-antitoxin system VapC family toxin [Methylococcus sp.]